MDRRKISDKGKSQAKLNRNAQDFFKRAAQDDERQRLLNKPEAARASTSKSMDLKSKSGEHSVSRHSHAINQPVWEKQRHSDHGASKSRQRQNSSVQLQRFSKVLILQDKGTHRRDEGSSFPTTPVGWQQAMLRRSSRPPLGGRSFNPSLRRKSPALAGGGEGEESSSQQQGETGKYTTDTPLMKTFWSYMNNEISHDEWGAHARQVLEESNTDKKEYVRLNTFNEILEEAQKESS